MNPYGFDMRQLRAFITVADLRSFSRAAAVLGFSQPAVSQQIARLEKVVGAALVGRSSGPRPVTLTPAGEVFAEHARGILDRARVAAADIEAMQTGRRGTLRLGSFQSVGARLVPRLLHDYTGSNPEARVAVRESDDHDELLKAMSSGELDLTFVVYPVPIGPFTATHLLVDPYIAVVAADSALGESGEPLSIDALRNQDLITFQPVRFQSTESRINRPWISECTIHHANYTSSIVGMAAEGVGIGIVPWLSFDAMNAGVVYRRLIDVRPRVVGIAWRNDRALTPLAEAFVERARVVAEDEQRLILDTLGSFDLNGYAE